MTIRCTDVAHIGPIELSRMSRSERAMHCLSRACRLSGLVGADIGLHVGQNVPTPSERAPETYN